MNKAETKAAIAVMQAFVDGKTIEVSSKGGAWHNSDPGHGKLDQILLWDWCVFT